MWQIYSEASIGKAYKKKLGVVPFLQQHPDFSKDVLGKAMSTYYGGGSGIRIRLQPVEVIYCDFKSQYPTVNALMGVQDLLLAEHIDVQPCPEATQAFLNRITLDDLHHFDTWRRLLVLVQLRPDQDLLPVRAQF